MTVRRASCPRNACPEKGNEGRRVGNTRSVTTNSRIRSSETRTTGTGRLFRRVLLAYVRPQSGRNAESCRRPDSAHMTRVGRSGEPPGTTACPGLRDRLGVAVRARPRRPARNRQLTSQAPERNCAMPAEGKHRRPKTPRFSRSLAVAGTGGSRPGPPAHGGHRSARRDPRAARIRNDRAVPAEDGGDRAAGPGCTHLHRAQRRLPSRGSPRSSGSAAAGSGSTTTTGRSSVPTRRSSTRV